jgi:primase-polymerase (primpol)-like protein
MGQPGANNPPDAAGDNIPDELKPFRQWVCHREKVPMNPHTTAKASVNDARTWGTYAEAVRAAPAFDGIGFVFTPTDPYCGIDLDHCRDPRTGQLEDWAYQIVQRFDSYTEASPSGTGVHILCHAQLPITGGQRGHVEMYVSGRYFTMTGEHIGGTQTTIEPRQDAVDALYQEYFPRAERTHARGAGKQHTLSEAEIARIKDALSCIPASVGYEVWREWLGGTCTPSVLSAFG